MNCQCEENHLTSHDLDVAKHICIVCQLPRAMSWTLTKCPQCSGRLVPGETPSDQWKCMKCKTTFRPPGRAA